MMLSSAGQHQYATRCRELGISLYLTKPIKPSELKDAVMTALNRECLQETLSPVVARQALPGAGRRLHVLLAEDNAVNQLLAARLLEKQGHTVVVASNGQEALSALDREPFDLVLMGVQMPGMNGIEATVSIRERERSSGCSDHMPIIALTAHAMKGDRERCLEAGMDGSVSKPIQAAELFSAIEASVPVRSQTLPDAPETPERTDDVLDRTPLPERVEGDEELATELMCLFRDECPTLLLAIQEAVVRGDCPALERTAHTLKGSAGNLCARGVSEAALRLEMIGREARLAQAQEALTALEAAPDRLKVELDPQREQVRQ